MPNNLTPEYVIVPREASDEMMDAISDVAKIEWDEYSALGEEGARVKGSFSIINVEECVNAALSAAPSDHGLVMVDKGELAKTISRLKGVVDGNPMTAAWLNPIIHDISKIYVTALQAAVKAAGGAK